MQKFVDLVLVGNNADDAVAGECIGSITQETNRSEIQDTVIIYNNKQTKTKLT
jgi:hypothetical protein